MNGLYQESLDTSSTDVELFEFVKNEDFDPSLELFPRTYRDRVLIDTIHTGNWIPEELYHLVDSAELREKVRSQYNTDRDWGANHVAKAISKHLNLPGYFRVNVARVLLDFGRFRGASRDDDGFLAIGNTFSRLLSHESKSRILRDFYDAIATAMENAASNALLRIGIHTYDKRNSPIGPRTPGAVRPLVSLLYTPYWLMRRNPMPFGTFDPLYPDELGDVVDRRLTSRMSLSLEENHTSVSHNNPYSLGAGSVEVRLQVWYFFRMLQQRFEEENESLLGSEEYDFPRVWEMLKDANLRNTDTETLRSYLHTHRRPPENGVETFEKARRAYEAITKWFEERRGDLLEEYRFGSTRPISFAIEVRKDHIWEFKKDSDGREEPVDLPDGAIQENVDAVSARLAEAILQYLNEDLGGLKKS